jgi:hypothetical protein
MNQKCGEIPTVGCFPSRLNFSRRGRSRLEIERPQFGRISAILRLDSTAWPPDKALASGLDPGYH